MNNKQIRYLDKVVEFLIRETDINYELEELTFNFILLPAPYRTSFHWLESFYLSLPIGLPYLDDYCKNTYGLTEEEIEYVWEQYKHEILDKIYQ